MKNILNLIILFCLSGCNVMNTSFDDNELRAKRKAVVIMRSKGIAEDVEPFLIATRWLNKDTKKWFNTESSANLFGISSCNHDEFFIYMIDPGIYSLCNIEFVIPSFWKPKKYSASNLQGIGYFKVNGGDVVYIGDVFFDTRNTSVIAKAININDNFNEAQNFMRQNYPLLFSNMKKELVLLSTKVENYKKIDNYFGLIGANK